MNFPDKPGIYLFKDKEGKVIYVGKAKSLKKRLANYSQKKFDKGAIIAKASKSVDFIVTDSEKEALILESNLIKKHNPKYNVLLKDSKRYAYIELTNEKFPRLNLARKPIGKGKYFGPFISGGIRDTIITSLRRSFFIRTCTRLPKRPCLRYQMNLCKAPCANKISIEEYSNNILSVENVLKGQISQVISQMKESMDSAVTNQNFETALELRDQIKALNYLLERQNMERLKKHNEDIINYLINENQVHIAVFNVHRGILHNKFQHTFPLSPDFFESFLMQYYSENNIPKELILPEKIGNTLKKHLEEKKQGKIIVTIPVIGEKLKLLHLVNKNIEITNIGDFERLEDLKVKLKLGKIPNIIECFDISHISGTHTVASMVQFKNGIPDKSNYRKYKIKSYEGIDDFSGIKEVVKRRYTRLREGSVFPDLIVIDGGKGQLTSALEELYILGLKIPTIAIAKKFEEIYVPGLKRPLTFKKKSPGLTLLQYIRNEAHRFAINYNRLLRKKSVTK